MLFVVDNSNSMSEEQGALRTQFAHLIEVLATGDPDGDGMNDFPPVKDLHLGVVSSDMGLLGIDGVDNCSGFGDDGILQHPPQSRPSRVAQASLSVVPQLRGGRERSEHDRERLRVHRHARHRRLRLRAAARVGAQGAVAVDRSAAAMGGIIASTFLGDSQNGQGMLGHGDTDNLGFLRNDPTQGLSRDRDRRRHRRRRLLELATPSTSRRRRSSIRKIRWRRSRSTCAVSSTRPTTRRRAVQDRALRQRLQGAAARQREPGRVRRDHRRAARSGRSAACSQAVDFADQTSRDASTRAS